MTFDEALSVCEEYIAIPKSLDLDAEVEYVKADTSEEMQKVHDECSRIAKERLKKGLY